MHRRRPLWSDWPQYLHVGWRPRCNQLWKFFENQPKGFGAGRSRNMAFPLDFAGRTYKYTLTLPCECVLSLVVLWTPCERCHTKTAVQLHFSKGSTPSLWAVIHGHVSVKWQLWMSLEFPPYTLQEGCSLPKSAPQNSLPQQYWCATTDDSASERSS